MFERGCGCGCCLLSLTTCCECLSPCLPVPRSPASLWLVTAVGGCPGQVSTLPASIIGGVRIVWGNQRLGNRKLLIFISPANIHTKLTSLVRHILQQFKHVRELPQPEQSMLSRLSKYVEIKTMILAQCVKKNIFPVVVMSSLYC